MAGAAMSIDDVRAPGGFSRFIHILRSNVIQRTALPGSVVASCRVGHAPAPSHPRDRLCPVTYDPDSVSPLIGRSILVVDDVGMVRRTLFRFLSEAGARVFEAASVGEALEVLSTARPPINLVIADS